MSEWKECTLKDVAEKFAMGPFGSNIKAENFTTSGVPVIRGTNLNFYKYVAGGFVFLTEGKANQLKSSYCFPGDLVFTHRGTIGQVGLIPVGKYPKYIISQSGMKVTVNSNLIDNEFLFYFFKSPRGQHELLQHESQVGVPSISNPLTSLKSVSLLLPTLPEQQAIASVLSSLDDKIDLLHRQNETMEAMAAALFRQWFVEEVNDCWENKPLGNYVSVVDNRGKTPPNREEYTPYPVIEVNALGGKDRLVDYSAIKKYVDEETYRLWFRDNLQKFDILISTVGSIGAISMYVIEKGNIAQNVIGLHANNISPFYLYQILRFKAEEILQFDIGGVQPSIKVPHLLSIKIAIPSGEMQNKFDNQLLMFVEKMECNYKQIRTLEKLRDTLLPKLMSGEVRVAV